MQKLLIYLLLITLCAYDACGSFINQYPRYEKYRDMGDAGDALYLTPYIEQNRIDEAKKLAKVDHPQLNFAPSYSGYLTVNKTCNSNLFFWFIQAYHDWENAPLVLWLQGGPGASSLFGLFTENGPYDLIAADRVSARKYSWHLAANLIYIDNPVGTGFSFTDNDDCYARNEDDVGINLYRALSQFIKLFPELKNNRFYPTGESYAGKYVPAVAHYIHTMNQKADTAKINMAGIAIGNGLSDPVNQLKYGEYLYQLGLVDLNGLHLIQKYQEDGRKLIEQGKYLDAFHLFDNLIDGDKTPYSSVFKNLTGMESYFNYVNDGPDKSDEYLGKFVQSSEVRRAIHVGSNIFHDLTGENRVEDFLEGDVMASVAPWVSELLSHYHTVIYNGQLDIIVAYPLTVNYLQNLKFSGDDEYKTKVRYIWRVDNEIAGYVKDAGNLTEILVRNAGHMVPANQPKWAFDIITRLTSGKSFY